MENSLYFFGAGVLLCTCSEHQRGAVSSGEKKLNLKKAIMFIPGNEKKRVCHDIENKEQQNLSSCNCDGREHGTEREKTSLYILRRLKKS